MFAPWASAHMPPLFCRLASRGLFALSRVRATPASAFSQKGTRLLTTLARSELLLLCGDGNAVLKRVIPFALVASSYDPLHAHVWPLASIYSYGWSWMQMQVSSSGIYHLSAWVRIGWWPIYATLLRNGVLRSAESTLSADCLGRVVSAYSLCTCAMLRSRTAASCFRCLTWSLQTASFCSSTASYSRQPKLKKPISSSVSRTRLGSVPA